MRRFAGLVVVLAGAMLALSQTAPLSAHATLRSSNPAANAFVQRAPGAIVLTFTEPIDPRSSYIQVLDGNGALLETPTATVDDVVMSTTLPALKPGIYNVLWENVSRIDGHAISGSYPFTVLNPDGSLPDLTNTFGGVTTESDPAPLADGIVVRLLSLVGLALVAAGALITLLWREAPPGLRRGLLWTVYGGVGVLGVATLLNLQTIRDAYSGVGIRELVVETPSGGYWLTRFGLVLFVAAVASFLLEAPKRASAVVLGGVAVYLWAFTATSHAAAAGSGSAWARGFDFVHGAAAIAWIGAVVGVTIAARLGRRDLAWGALMPRFGLLASTMVFLLLATGFLATFVQVDEIEKLWETRYGVVLLVKLGLMLPLLGVALYNARVGKVRLAAGAPGEPRRFLMFAFAEVALGMLVFGAAATLTQTTNSRSVTLEAETPVFDMTSMFGDLSIRLNIDPNQTGLNTYRVELADQAGAALEAERVRLTFRYQEDPTIGASSLTLTSGATGGYLGQGPFMTLEGRWRVEVEVRRTNVNDVVAFYDVRPAGPPVVAGATGGAWSRPTPGLTWNQFGGLVFVLTGLGFALARTPLRSLGKGAGWAANGVTMAGFSAGVLLFFGVHSHTPADGVPTNPIFPDANSIAQGRALYEANCITCHGRTGVPPAGLELSPYPLDLTIHVPQHPDGDIYNFIANGVPGSAMIAWRAAGLSEDEIWHIVNYLRTLAPVNQ